MIFAYYVGGPLDLSKQALNGDTPPLEVAAYEPVHFEVSLKTTEVTTIPCRRVFYRLLGPCRNERRTFVYEFDRRD
jgi:hypothetical protein